MKKLITGGLAAAGIALAIAGATPAQADTNQFLYAMDYDGFHSPGGSATMLDWGYRVCNDQAAGASMAYSAFNIERQTSLTYTGAMQVVRNAKLFLC